MLTLSAISKNRYRVILLCAGLVVAVVVTWLLLAPGRSRSSEYKFMHCKVCKSERAYESSFSTQKCLKCAPKKEAAFVPTVSSISGGANPWKGFSIAVALEFIVFMGLLLYVLKAKAEQVVVRMLYCNCPKCKWRLRFRETSAGKSGQCPRCKYVFKFPEAVQADTREFPSLREEPSESWSET